MAKFNISTVVPGQVSELSQKAAAESTPTPTKREPDITLPQPESFADLAGTPAGGPPTAPGLTEAVGEGVTAGLEREAALGAQREREQVQPIKERYADQDRVDVYDYRGQREADEGPSSDGGLAARAKNFADKISGGAIKVSGIGTAAPSASKEIFQTMRAIDAEGQPNYDFLKIAAVVTENTIADLAFNEGLENVTPEDQVTANELQGQEAVSKLQGNQNLGQQINREWQRTLNQAEGKPTDEYTDLSPEQALMLGDMAKELYYEANKMEDGAQFITRQKTEDGQVAFGLTKHGSDRLKEGQRKRKRLFPKQHVRPSKTALPGGRLVGEGRTYTKRVSTKAGKPLAGAKEINQAMNNLGQVANVVDGQRLKILLATALPVLAGKVQPDSVEAGMNHVGQDKLNAFAAKADKDPEFDAAQNYADLINDLAQSIFGIAQEKDGANYLSYYVQAFNGRIAPQQTHFDPTTSKTVRFVTRNAVPAKATPGSRIEKNLRQMYAMMLVKGADSALPAERERMLESATPQLVRWGKQLISMVDQISDQQVQQAVDAIKAGTPVTDQSFPQLPQLEINDQTLIDAIRSKGEDGQAFVDGVIDFTKYYENKLKGRPHFSYFNAYMDGKTNGLASNGLQMGSEEVAFKTGVLRSQGKTLLDGDADIRDALRDTLLELVDQNGFDGDLDKFGGDLIPIAKALYSNRDLNKSTTMTFGYGMELDSFKRVMDNFLSEMEQGDPVLAEQVRNATVRGSRDELISTLHNKYVEGLANALDPNALASRGLMRGAAMLHALTNELFSIEGPTGLALNFGGTTRGEWEQVGSYRVDGQRRYAGEAPSIPTAAAPKRFVNEETGAIESVPGEVAYGGSVPGPVQAIDAATVALTSSGRSWDRLRMASSGNPYLHTIYDAFKVDAMGYDVVLDEVNKNWLNAGMDWSYLEETKNAIASLREKWGERIKGQPDNTPLTPVEWSMADYLLTPVKSKAGRVYPANLVNKLSKVLADPDDAFEAAMRITNQLQKLGYDYKYPREGKLGDLKNFIRLFSMELDLDNRLGQMIKTTNAKKKKLKQKIKSSGAPVYQYYSH